MRNYKSKISFEYSANFNHVLYYGMEWVAIMLNFDSVPTMNLGKELILGGWKLFQISTPSTEQNCIGHVVRWISFEEHWCDKKKFNFLWKKGKGFAHAVTNPRV